MSIISRSTADRKRLELAALNNSKPVSSLEVKERAFAAKLLEYSSLYGIDLSSLDSINITSLTSAAESAGLSEDEIARCSSCLTTLILDIMSESDLLYKETWDRLKTNLPRYFEDIIKSSQ